MIFSIFETVAKYPILYTNLILIYFSQNNEPPPIQAGYPALASFLERCKQRSIDPRINKF